MMDLLYGVTEADHVYNRIQALDPQLNEEIQRIAYDHFWARAGLSLRDKSYVTVVSLIAMGKEEQTRIHLSGLLNAGMCLDGIIQTMQLFHILGMPDSSRKALIALREVLSHQEADCSNLKSVDKALEHGEPIRGEFQKLSARDLRIAEVSVFVANGNLGRLKIAMQQYFAGGGGIETLKNILIHQIVYCGFPSAMNGFAVLKDVQDLR